MKEERYHAVTWTPEDVFDYATNGRALSHEEVKILRRDLLARGESPRVRAPEMGHLPWMAPLR